MFFIWFPELKVTERDQRAATKNQAIGGRYIEKSRWDRYWDLEDCQELVKDFSGIGVHSNLERILVMLCVPQNPVDNMHWASSHDPWATSSSLSQLAQSSNIDSMGSRLPALRFCNGSIPMQNISRNRSAAFLLVMTYTWNQFFSNIDDNSDTVNLAQFENYWQKRPDITISCRLRSNGPEIICKNNLTL